MSERKGIIVGAGIGGLTAAVALRRLGIAVEVFEAAPVLEPVGAGIWMAPNAMQVFARLGLAEEIAESGLAVETVAVFDQRLKPILVVPQSGVVRRFGFSITAIHRGALQRVIRSHVPDDVVHLGKKLISLRHEARVTAVFADGTEATGDFLIGADGLNSVTRSELFGAIPLRYSGTTCWRGVVDFALPQNLRRATSELWGRHLRFGSAEIKPGTVYWFAVKTATRDGSDAPEEVRQRLLSEFQEFAEPVCSILAATPQDRIVRNDLCDIPPRRPWSQGLVCLIGDAAHPMTPDMGQGGAQAVEDAYSLSLELARPQQPAEAFAAFEARRFAKVEAIVKESHRLNRTVHSRMPPVLRNALFRMIPPALTERLTNRVYDVPDL